MKRLYVFGALLLGFNHMGTAQTDLIVNGGFQSGSSSWVANTNFWNFADASNSNCLSSLSKYAFHGKANGDWANSSYGSLYQEVTIPANTQSATLEVDVSINTFETRNSAYDGLEIQFRSPTMQLLRTFKSFSNLDGAYGDNSCQTYTNHRITIPQEFYGQTVRVNFQAANDNAYPTVFRVDNVKLLVIAPGGNCSAPTTQASNLTFSNITASQIRASWSNGNGSRRIVKVNMSNSFAAPANGTDPSDNSAYTGSGEQTVYNGTGNSITVTGLATNTTYWFRVYEANCTGSNSRYNTATGTNNPKSQATLQGQGCVQPSITSDVNSSYTFCQGQSGSISITVIGTSLSYQWHQYTGGTWSGVSGQTSNIFTPTSAGTYRCRVSNSCGAVYSNQTNISFNNCNGPVANFSAAKGILVAGQSTQFTDQSSGNPTSWTWVIQRELYNGTTIPYKTTSTQNPTISFNNPGCFKVTLTVSNTNGSNTLSKPCYVYVKPDLNAPIPETVTRAHSWYSYSAGDPVNSATGAFTFSMRDLSVKGIASTIAIERTYNSRSTYIGPFGKGWHFNYDIWIDTSIDTLWEVHHGDGHSTYHIPYPAGETRSLYSGMVDSLSYSYTGALMFKYTLRNGTVYNFANLGTRAVLTSIVDRNGNTTAFSYQDGMLSDMTAPGGRQFIFSYNDRRRYTSICDKTGRAVHFYYSPDGIYLDSTTIGNSTTRFKYDNYGLAEIIDPRGNRVLKNTYAPGPVVVEQRDAYDRVTKFEYKTPEESSTTITSPAGTRRITHDPSFHPIYIEDELGNVRQFSFSQNNALEIYLNERKYQTRNFYDERNNRIKSINAKFYRDSIAYSSWNDPTYIKDKAGNIYTFEYDAKGNVIKTNLPDGGVIERQYNAWGLDTVVTDARSNKTRKKYNSYGDLMSIVTPTGEWKYAYDIVGRKIAMTDPNGNTDSLFYNYFDQIVKLKDPLGYTVEYTYDLNGNRTSYKDKEGRKTQYGYDLKDNLTTNIAPGNRITRIVYDEVDRKAQLILPDNNRVLFKYNKASHLIEIRDSLAGQIKTFEYYEDGTLKTEGNEFGKKWTYTRDELSLVREIIDPLGNRVSYDYNPNNLVVGQTDARGKTTLFAADALNRIHKVTDQMQGKVERFFDKNGNLDSLRDAKGVVQTFQYDASNRLIQYFDGSTTWKYSWDKANNLIKVTDGLQNTIEYKYNGNHELQTVTVNGVQEKYFGRNKNGEIDTAESKAGKYIFIRNASGFVSTVKDVWQNSTPYEYDSVGHITAIVYPGNKRVEYKWSSLNRLVSVKDWHGRYYYYNWYTQGKVSGITLPNGTSVEYTIDDAYRYVSKVHKQGGNTVHSNLVKYDTSYIGEDTGIVILKPAFSSGDKSGTYGTGDIIETYGSVQYTHDANGNRKTATGGIPAELNNYQYTWDNRISSFAHQGISVANTFDVFGNRVKKVHNTGGHTTRYILDYVLLPDRPALLQERDDNNNIRVSYLYDPFGMPLMRDSAGTVRYYHFDLYGNTIALTDQNGQITDIYACDVFGQYLNHKGTNTQPFTFQGMHGVQTEAKDLYYLWARFYDAKTGRFLSKDPITGSFLNTQTINRYTYGFNNPLVWSDPSGLTAVNNISYDILKLLNYKTQRVSGRAYTVEEFWKENKGRTFYDIITQMGYSDGLPAGPKMRYVIDPQTGFELDMRHVMVVGYLGAIIGQPIESNLTFPVRFLAGNLVGLGVEIGQLILGEASAFNTQDFYSNYVGALFASYQSLSGKDNQNWTNSFYLWISK